MPFDALSVNDGTAAVTFNRISFDGTKAIYEATSSSFKEPYTIMVSFQVPKSINGGVRLLVQVAKGKVDTAADTLKVDTAVFHTVMSFPKMNCFSEAELILVWTILKNVITNNVASILKGQFPSV